MQSVSITNRSESWIRTRHEMYSTTFCDKVFQLLTSGGWFSQETPNSLTIKMTTTMYLNRIIKVSWNNLHLNPKYDNYTRRAHGIKYLRFYYDLVQQLVQIRWCNDLKSFNRQCNLYTIYKSRLLQIKHVAHTKLDTYVFIMTLSDN